MRAVLDRVLRRFIVQGRLSVHWPDGAVTHYQGRHDSEGRQAGLRLASWRDARRMLLDPEMALGETYMETGLTPVDCSLYELLDVLMSNMEAKGSREPAIAVNAAISRLFRRVAQFNPVQRAQRNVAHHYDLNGGLYRLFLDRDRQYSCGYFPTGSESLEEAQALKKRHIARKLRLDRPGLEVLDIGSGWGGLAMTLAQDHGARVTGITLSAEQLAESRARAAAAGLADRVRFEQMDYRMLDRRFDRIVSVGMFEHVGIVHFRRFFATLQRCLAPDGVALLHSIGRNGPPGATNSWIGRYIFPGGYAPALSEVMPAIEASGLLTTDIEIWRLHYAQTLRHWRQRFASNRRAIAALYDERFCRMFEFYLAASELAFRRQNQMVLQIQLAQDQRAVPLTRDYLHPPEDVALAEGRYSALPS